jgi:RNA polymerase sigma factor (sigma-70 family)
MSRLSQVDLAPDVHLAACRGDPAARVAVYEAVAGPVFALACRLVGRVNAEDVFQDTMMRTFERIADFRAEAPFGIWVRAIAVNACLMHLRSPWRRFSGLFDEIGEIAQSAAPPETLAAPLVDPATAIDLDRLLSQLPPLARSVLWLHEVEGYSHEDIAAAFDRTPSFSKSQLSRAHARLRELAAGGASPPPRQGTPCARTLRLLP